jgi:hypothetical protein
MDASKQTSMNNIERMMTCFLEYSVCTVPFQLHNIHYPADFLKTLECNGSDPKREAEETETKLL